MLFALIKTRERVSVRYFDFCFADSISMNNLNDPPGWNIRPGPHEGPDGGKWNYALLVPMLGLAAFREYLGSKGVAL